MTGTRAPSSGRVVRLAVPLTFVVDLGHVDPDLDATPSPDRRVRVVHWDTHDLRLARWGVALEHRANHGWSLRLPATAEGVAAPDGLELHWQGSSGRPPDEALSLVRAYARQAPVEPVARLVTALRETSLHRRDGTGIAVIEESTVSVFSGARITQRFREVEVRTGDETPPHLLEAIVSGVEAGGGQRTGGAHAVARALGMTGPAPPELAVSDLGRGSSVGDVVRRALAASVVRLISHDPGVRIGRHPEDVHQARVATRRLRSDLRTFRPLLDREWVDGLREELRWLAAELGRVRDAEVLRDRLRAAVAQLTDVDRRAAASVVAPLGAQVGAARRHLLRAMDGRREIELLDRLIEAARSPALAIESDAIAREALPALVRRPWKALRAGAMACRGDVHDEQLHDLRIRAKRCRYAAEAAAPVVGKRAAAFAKEVAALQEVLGELHDAVVAEAWLRHRSSASRLDDDAVFAAGELVALQRSAAQHARDAWPAAWRRAASRWTRAWD